MHKYTKVNVAGDGACYFHSVTGYLELEKNVKKLKYDKKYTYYKKGDASQLRRNVVSWLRKNLDYKLPNGLTIQDDIEDEITQNPRLSSVDDYLDHMSKESSYAGQIELTATANILNRNIRVYVLDQGKYRNIGFGYEINKSKTKDISLFHNMKRGISKGNHFEILFPTSKGQVVTKSQYDKLRSKPKKTVRRRTHKKPKKGRKTKRGRNTRKTMRRRLHS